MSTHNLDTALAYYAAIGSGNPQLAAEKLADTIEIITPLAHQKGKNTVVESLKGFSKAVESITINARMASGNEVMLTYDILFPEPTGNLKAAGLLTFDNDLIARIEMFYDTKNLSEQKDKIFSKEAS